jgi:PTS system N-acetylglucosamine-specific IIA component
MKVLSPVAGQNLAVSEIPDPVFASGLVGPGVAIRPHRGLQTAVSPIPGTLVRLLPHAYVVLSPKGPAVLVHLGIDTVHMRGEGFTLVAHQDDAVEPGTDIVTWDPDYVAGTGRSPLCAVVILDCDAPMMLEAVGEDVAVGQPIFSVDC